MARIPYPDDADPELAALRARVLAERGQLHNLYRMLMHSQPVAQGWLTFLTAIRQQCRLDARARELAILRIAVLNRAHYEFTGHVPHAIKAGLTREQVDAVQRWDASDLFPARDRTVLAYADAMTREVQVPDPVFDAIRREFPATEVVELTATIAAYNMVSRFLEAMQVDLDPH